MALNPDGVVDLTESPSPPPQASRPRTPDKKWIDLTEDGDNIRNEAADASNQSRSDDEDEDLRRAIALSLAQHEAEQDAQAWETSRKGMDGVSNATGQSGLGFGEGDGDGIAFSGSRETVPSTVGAAEPSASNGLSSFLGLDRKTMEAKRLARLKRKREEADNGRANLTSPGVAAAARETHSRTVSPPPLTREAVVHKPKSKSSTSSISTKPAAIPGDLAATASPHHPQTFPSGIVLKTYAPGYPTDRTVSFPDLIAPAADLQSCLLSSYIWDFDWLLPHFDTKRTNFLLVMHAKHAGEREDLERQFKGIKNVKLCFPPMEGQVNCMHSKLMLLFYGGDRQEGSVWKDGRCRIVVPTANLMGFDWGVGSVMENMVWLIDLPVLEVGKEEGETSGFKQSLLRFLDAQGVPGEVGAKLQGFDFGKTRDIGLVHSIGGSHTGEAWRDTGHCGLGKTVQDLGLATAEPVAIDFVTSSVGSLNDEFMRAMYLACQGDDGLVELNRRAAKPFPAKGKQQERFVVAQGPNSAWKENFRFYFPSQQTVDGSNGGRRSAGTICFNENWWQGANFPRANMRDCVSGRSGLLMHDKIAFVRYQRVKPVSGQPCIGWTYVGSGNLSESAWGRLVLDKSTKAPKLNCRNWEIGVVLPVVSGGAEYNAGSNLAEFDHHIPVPMVVPAQSYDGSVKKPWFFRST